MPSWWADCDLLVKVPVLVLFVCEILCVSTTSSSHSSQPRTTYMGQIMAYELQREPDPELATRKGEFAMLLYSIGEFL